MIDYLYMGLFVSSAIAGAVLIANWNIWDEDE